MSLYRRPGSKFWQCEFEVAGERIQKSTRETDRERALRAELRFKLAAREATPRVRRGPGSLRELGALDVIDAEDAKTTANHVRSLRWMWRAIDAHFGAEARIDAITLDSMKDYVRARERQGIRGQSIRREISALKRACRIAVRKGWLSSFPSEWPRVKSDAPDARRRGKLRTADEIAAVAALCSPSARDLIHFAAMTGLRRHELARVRLEWMQATSAGPILVVPQEASKTRREREIALSARAVEILRRRGERTPVFAPHTASVRDSIKRASKEAGLSSTLTLRDLRHYYSTVGLAASGDAVAVQSQMGHTDLRTTERYQHSTRERAAAVSAAVERSLRGTDDLQAEEQRLLVCGVRTGREANPEVDARGESNEGLGGRAEMEERSASVDANDSAKGKAHQGRTLGPDPFLEGRTSVHGLPEDVPVLRSGLRPSESSGEALRDFVDGGAGLLAGLDHSRGAEVRSGLQELSRVQECEASNAQADERGGIGPRRSWSPTVSGEKREDPDSSESSATSVVGAAGFEPTAPCTPSIVPRVITVTCCDSCVAALRELAAKCAAGSRHRVPDSGSLDAERKKAG